VQSIALELHQQVLRTPGKSTKAAVISNASSLMRKIPGALNYED
jgi:hypothetical protein